MQRSSTATLNDFESLVGRLEGSGDAVKLDIRYEYREDEVSNIQAFHLPNLPAKLRPPAHGHHPPILVSRNITELQTPYRIAQVLSQSVETATTGGCPPVIYRSMHIGPELLRELMQRKPGRRRAFADLQHIRTR